MSKKKLYNASLHSLILSPTLAEKYEVIELDKEILTINLNNNLKEEQLKIIKYLIENIEPGSYVYTSGHLVLTSAVMIACDMIPATLVYCYIDTSTGRIFEVKPIHRSPGSIPRKIRIELEELKKQKILT